MFRRITMLAALLAAALSTGGCSFSSNLNDLKPVELPPLADKMDGNYAISITGARTKSLTVTVREPSLGQQMAAVMPYGDILANKLEADIKAYAGGTRMIVGEESNPMGQSDDDGLIQVRMRQASANALMEGYRMLSGAYSPKKVTVTIFQESEVIVRDKSGKSLRRDVTSRTVGVSENWLVGMATLVPGASRDAMEKSLSEFSRKVVTEVLAMRRELAARPSS